MALYKLSLNTMEEPGFQAICGPSAPLSMKVRNVNITQNKNMRGARDLQFSSPFGERILFRHLTPALPLWSLPTATTRERQCRPVGLSVVHKLWQGLNGRNVQGKCVMIRRSDGVERLSVRGLREMHLECVLHQQCDGEFP